MICDLLVNVVISSFSISITYFFQVITGIFYWRNIQIDLILLKMFTTSLYLSFPTSILLIGLTNQAIICIIQNKRGKQMIVLFSYLMDPVVFSNFFVWYECLPRRNRLYWTRHRCLVSFTFTSSFLQSRLTWWAEKSSLQHYMLYDIHRKYIIGTSF